MEFRQVVKVPKDRIGVLIGKDGSVKEMVEKRCNVKLYIESDEDASVEIVAGNADITTSTSTSTSTTSTSTSTHEGEYADKVFKAIEFVTAIAKGFSPDRAMRLLNDEECMINVIDLKDYVGRSYNALQRVKGRLIGSYGKARRLIEELTGAYISVYGHYVAIIGKAEEVRLASEAVTMLINGSMHSTVYNMLQKARRRAKMERLKLWEDEGVGDVDDVGTAGNYVTNNGED
ncbi:MAG: KH domain-containing protein [Candidatus Nitrosocaldus sp.]